VGPTRHAVARPMLVRFIKDHLKPLVFSAWAVGVLVAFLRQFQGSLDGIGDVLGRIFGGG
jgi:hypothetical protein